MEFASGANSFDDLRGWKFTIKCVSAAVGRIDGWMAGERLAQFRDGPLLETARTIGMPATSNNVIAVASHVSKNTWMSDLGIQSAPVAVVDRSSRFSSRGPTRDGRQKPEISAPGEMITAALADKSELANEPTRANSAAKLLTIEGTSMATPFVTGVVVLLLQRNGTLAAVDVIDVFRTSAVKDQHTGPTDWTPEYGHGKISGEQAAKAVAAVVASIAAPTTAHPSRRAGPAKKATTATAKRAKTKVTVPA